MKSLKYISLILPILLILTGCGQDNPFETLTGGGKETGSLTVNVKWSGGSVPAEVNSLYFTISGEGIETTSVGFERTKSRIEVTDLATGNKTVVLSGKNSSGEAIYKGESSTSIGKNENKEITVTLSKITTPGSAPSAPTGVSASVGDGKVTISWNSVSGATSYNIYWKTTSGVTKTNGTKISYTSPYTHTGRTNGTTYYYVVTAVNSYGESAESTEKSATPSATGTAPSAPIGVSASAGDGQITISWSSVSGATSYNIYWSTSSGVTKTIGTKITAVTSPYIHTGRTNGTTYYYVVTAVNSYGESAESTEKSATPSSGTVSDTTAPSNPTTTSGYSSSSKTTTLTSGNWYNYSTPYFEWSGASDGTGSGIAGYYVYFGTSSTADPATSGAYQTGSTFTSTSTLSSGSTYYLLIKAKDNAGYTATATYTAFTYKYDTTAPSTPTGLTATAISDTRIDLSWTASTSTDVTGYKIYRDGTSIGTSTTTSYSDTGLSVATSYTYTVTAVDTAGNESSQSTSASATTKGTIISAGSISTDTTWTLANSPYILTGNILVNNSVTLTIEAGVTVKFSSGKALQIDGTLIARGTGSNKITFTSNQATPAAGDWVYIQFSDSSTDATYDASGNYTGGSILEYAVVEYAGGATVSENGAVKINSAYPFINYCTIRNNKASGIYAYNSVSGTLKITNNTIMNNTASSSGGGIYVYGSTTTISNNNVSNNTSSSNGGGIYVSYYVVTISNNSITKNSAKNGSAVYYNATNSATNKDIKYNTITGNQATDSTNTYTIYVKLDPLFNYNNIFSNTATYELWNDNASGSAVVNVENNWWGTATESVIQTKIYDWFDDPTKGRVDYTPWLTTYDTTAPISPPTGLTATAGTGQIALSWTANTESDTAGYKVYWDTDSGYPYANSTDVGNVTSYTIGSLPVGTYYVTLTAYDTTASTVTDDPNTIVNEKQTAGNESWYAEEKSASVTSSSFKPALMPDINTQQEPQLQSDIQQADSNQEKEEYAVGCGTIKPKGGNGGGRAGSDPALILLLLLPLLIRLWQRLGKMGTNTVIGILPLTQRMYTGRCVVLAQ